jgi:hypothetical protein
MASERFLQFWNRPVPRECRPLCWPVLVIATGKAAVDARLTPKT